MSKSNYLENKVLDHSLGTTAFTMPTNAYVALSSADPTDDGSGVTEPVGAWYARESATFGAASAGSASNDAVVDFTAAGGDLVDVADNGYSASHFAIFDAVTAGNMLYHGALTQTKVLATDDEVKFPIGSLTVTED